MVRNLGKKVVIWSLVLIFTFITTGAASALSSERLGRFSNYRIYFYDPDAKCVEGTTIAGGRNSAPYAGDEQWNGSCTAMTATRATWLKKQIPGMQKVATANGLPWELIAAQAIAESGGGSQEVCPYNPLGLKGSGPSCNGRHRSFNSYEEAYQHYVDSIIPIKKVKYKYPNDPYSAIAYIQYGSGAPYAQCSKQEYLTNPNHSCYGHNLGDPTPSYVNNVSSIICGLQKWAKGEGIAISSVTWETYSPSEATNEEPEEVTEEEIIEYENKATYCNEEGSSESGEDEDYEAPESGNLISYIKAWAWPEYHSAPYTNKKPAYADYINNQASYKGDCNGVDCGAFVANIIKASGWDTSYPQTGTAGQSSWLSKNWNRVSPDSLRLGDVGIKTGHVILYVGSIPGFGSNTASASQCERAPMAGADKNLGKYTWYRKR
ncbi:glucosaminidase domain-containing protein [Candidatus Saccharibacteria bacterium]|nr:glucosaminidase domain-containing protein [Candidatus Saccharibacteria bacterium]